MKEGPSPTEYFLARYPRELLVFGSDLGHQAFPEYAAGVRDWISELDGKLESSAMETVLVDNGKELLGK